MSHKKRMIDPIGSLPNAPTPVGTPNHQPGSINGRPFFVTLLLAAQDGKSIKFAPQVGRLIMVLVTRCWLRVTRQRVAPKRW
jgi:hypothetical protein